MLVRVHVCVWQRGKGLLGSPRICYYSNMGNRCDHNEKGRVLSRPEVGERCLKCSPTCLVVPEGGVMPGLPSIPRPQRFIFLSLAPATAPHCEGTARLLSSLVLFSLPHTGPEALTATISTKVEGFTEARPWHGRRAFQRCTQ